MKNLKGTPKLQVFFTATTTRWRESTLSCSVTRPSADMPAWTWSSQFATYRWLQICAPWSTDCFQTQMPEKICATPSTRPRATSSSSTKIGPRLWPRKRTKWSSPSSHRRWRRNRRRTLATSNLRSRLDETHALEIETTGAEAATAEANGEIGIETTQIGETRTCLQIGEATITALASAFYHLSSRNAGWLLFW